jgi:hypothetical protein
LARLNKDVARTLESAKLKGQEYEGVGDPLSIFLYALRAPETRRQYPRRLKVFLDHIGLAGNLQEQAKQFLAKVRSKPQWAQNSLMQFISFQRHRVELGQISPGTVANYYKATKLFVEMNIDTPIINWKRISRGLPRGRKAANDRSPTIEELRKLSGYPDRRIKPIIYTMASSGIRLGAWDYLQWKHVTPLTNENNEIVAAKLQVYPGDPEEYYCFITPEACSSIQEWMDYRAEHGEKISGDSWLMRDLWQTTDMKYGAMFGVATYPKKLKSSGIKSLLERAIRAQGLHKPLPVGVNRREWKGAHGIRKYYKTRAEQVMKPANVEITMGHDIGVSESYYKPTQRQIMEDYLKAVDILTIDDDRLTLEKRVAVLTQKNKEENHIISEKLSEKEREIYLLRERDMMNTDAIASLSEKLNKVMREIDVLKNRS